MAKMAKGFKGHQRVIGSTDTGSQIGRKGVVLTDPTQASTKKEQEKK